MNYFVFAYAAVSAVIVGIWCRFAKGDPLDDRILLVAAASLVWPACLTILILLSPAILGATIGIYLRKQPCQKHKLNKSVPNTQHDKGNHSTPKSVTPS